MRFFKISIFFDSIELSKDKSNSKDKRKMKDLGKRKIFTGIVLVSAFAIFTYLLQIVDVKPLGVNETDLGFFTFNSVFHKLFGVNMTIYIITDWAGLVPIFVALSFGILGFIQLIKRKSLFKVDADILILGVYYIVVSTLYVVFEMIPINYRPILINGFMETSYPSSTTLLVIGVMPTLAEQVHRRCKRTVIKTMVTILTSGFSVLMVLGRLISGVHWFTDILGSVIISIGLFYIYKGSVLIFCEKS